MAMAQLSNRSSLRNVVENISAQAHRPHHLGSTKLSHFNLSRINDAKPYALYEVLSGKLLNHYRGVVPGHNFYFNHPLYSLDTENICLCLSVFQWAGFQTTKGTIKLHASLNHARYLPEFATMTKGNNRGEMRIEFFQGKYHVH